MTASGAAQRWADELAAWAIPDEILARAPEDPWQLPPGLFGPARPGSAGRSLATERAAEVLDAGGSVLDVGCGGGAAAFALVPPAAEVIGVDQSSAMLERFEEEAARRGVRATTVAGGWLDVEAQVPSADVVTCHHVLYNVADLGPFGLALDGHARRRVVVELTERHPLTWLGPFWQHFWDLERPEGPDAELAAAVLTDAGLDVTLERGPATRRERDPEEGAAEVEMIRRRLCLPPERDGEIAALLSDHPEYGRRHSSRDHVVLWWSTS